MAYTDAISSGAIALFGEKYAADVRVLSMGRFSVELCGGTHAQRTGDIGLFKLTTESGVASGVRRIEALTGSHALLQIQGRERDLKTISGIVKSTLDDADKKVAQLADKLKVQDKEILTLKNQLAGQSSGELGSLAVEVGTIKVLSQAIEGADMAALRAAMDNLKDKLQEAVIVLATVEGKKVKLIAGVTKGLTGRLSAGELVNYVAQQVGGKGGGRPDMAQAGGTDPSELNSALESVVGWVSERA